jgi:hypothetical protein
MNSSEFIIDLDFRDLEINLYRHSNWHAIGELCLTTATLALRSVHVRVCALIVNIRQLLNELGNVWAECSVICSSVVSASSTVMRPGARTQANLDRRSAWGSGSPGEGRGKHLFRSSR